MNVHALVHARIVSALETLQREGALPAGLDFANVEVAPPREAAHGDLASNAALVLAKAAKMKPRDIADKLAEKLRALPDLEAVEVAGAGFLNLRFAPRFWQRRGGGNPEGRRRLRPRRAGPRRARQRRIRVGQPDGADACRPLPRCGVRRRAGEPAGLCRLRGHARVLHQRCRRPGRYTLARSAYLRYREALGEDIGEIPEGLYPGDYLKPVGAALAEEYGHTLVNFPEERRLPLVRDRAIAAMLATIEEDLGRSQRRARGLLFRARADGKPGSRNRGHHRGAAQEGARLRGPAGEAQGPRRRTSGRTASRRCSGPPPSATTSTAH